MSDVVSAIKERINIKDYIGRFVRLSRKTADRSIGLCPFHPEKTPSFTVSDTKGFFYCFGCQAKGDLIKFAEMIHNQTFMEALQQLADECGIDLKKQTQEDNIDQQAIRLLRKFTEAAHANLNERVKNYLESRGLKPETVKNYLIGFVDNQLLASFQKENQDLLKMLGINFALRDRILFPIFFKGKVCGFGARSLTEGGSNKYINSPESNIFHKSELIYGESTNGIKRSDTHILVEGYTDALLVNQNTEFAAYATLGTAVSETQCSLLMDKPLILCFDGDNAGRKACERALKIIFEIFQPGNMVSVASLPDGQDPGSMLALQSQVFKQKISEALEASEFIFNHLTYAGNLSSEQILIKQKQLQSWLNLAKNEQFKNALKRNWTSSFKELYKAKKQKQKPELHARVAPEEVCQLELLALIAMQPDLLDQISEDLAKVFLHKDLEIIRGKLLERDFDSWDVQNLIKGLKNKPKSHEEGLLKWKQTYKQLLKYQQENALKLLQKELEENFSEEIWHKIQQMHKILTDY